MNGHTSHNDSSGHGFTKCNLMKSGAKTGGGGVKASCIHHPHLPSYLLSRNCVTDGEMEPEAVLCVERVAPERELVLGPVVGAPHPGDVPTLGGVEEGA